MLIADDALSNVRCSQALNEVRTEMNMPEYIAPPIVGPAPGGVELASQKRVASQGGAALAAIASPEEIQALEADLQGGLKIWEVV
jgi:hypothetical protein